MVPHLFLLAVIAILPVIGFYLRFFRTLGGKNIRIYFMPPKPSPAAVRRR